MSGWERWQKSKDRAAAMLGCLSFLIVFTLLLMPIGAAQASPDYVCGDADGNGVVNVSDAVLLIAYIFGSGPAPDPLAAADCNLDGLVNIADAVYLVSYIFSGGPEPCLIPGGSLVNWFGCKYAAKGPAPDTVPSNLDCIFWEYDGQSVVQLQHVNAAANCCPTEIIAEITIVGSEITITEDEILDTPCYCLCLFDVDYQLNGIEPGEYTITIEGLYLDFEDPVQVTIDFATTPVGYYCVERTHYPWGAY